MKEKIIKLIKQYRKLKIFTPAEEAVLKLIETADSANPITQLNIVWSEKWLGCHPNHEKHLIDNTEIAHSTTRRVREIIRDIRLKYGILILANTNGYYLAESAEEVMEYLDGVKRKAVASMQSAMQNYYILGKAIDLKDLPLLNVDSELVAMAQANHSYDLIKRLDLKELVIREGVPLNMRIGNKPISFLNEKVVRDSISQVEYVIKDAHYVGCFAIINEEHSVYWFKNHNLFSVFDWRETTAWEIVI